MLASEQWPLSLRAKREYTEHDYVAYAVGHGESHHTFQLGALEQPVRRLTTTTLHLQPICTSAGNP